MTDFPASFVVATCDELLAHINACHAVLAQVEWSATTTDYDLDACPQCWGLERDGHRPDCALRACLDGKP